MANKLIQNTFNGGEWSELMEGRTDLAKYANALYRLERFLIDPRGPAVRCPGWRYIAGTKTNSTQSVLIPFEFSKTQAYQLEFGNQYIRVYKEQAQIQSGGSPYEIASPYLAADVSSIQFCQSADVLYLFHPNYATRKLSRTSDTDFQLDVIAFKPGALTEEGYEPSVNLTLSATSGEDITVTADAAVFLTGDVGRVITSGAGRMAITSLASSTVVNCDVIDAFSSTSISSGDWRLNGSPTANIKLSDKTPVGAVITITGPMTYVPSVVLKANGSDYWLPSASNDEWYLHNGSTVYSSVKPTTVEYQEVALTELTVGALTNTGGVPDSWGWGDNDSLGYNTIYVKNPGGDIDNLEFPLIRTNAAIVDSVFSSADVGKYIRIYGGIIKITSFVSSGEVRGEIIKEPTATDATRNWTLESEAWNETNGYPSCGVFFEERLIVAGSPAYPETFWGSQIGDYENFTPGIDDADAIEFTLAGRQVNSILWMYAMESLMIGTVGGEWSVTGEDGKSLSPLNVTAKERRNYGSSEIRPASVDGSILFVQRAGRKVREFTYQWESNGYASVDLTLLAEHVTEGTVAGMVYQKEPHSILWVWMADGTVSALTYLRDQEVVAWHTHPTLGDVESMSVIPGNGYDEVWAVIKRTINGQTVRYVEMLEALFTDSPTEYTNNKGLNAFFVDSGITYNGAATTTITGLSHLEGEEVSVLANGNIVSGKTVSGGQITVPAGTTVAHVGLPYTSLLQTMRLDANTPQGTGLGSPKKIHEIVMRVYRSGTFKAGRNEDNLDTMYDREREIVMGAPYPLFTGDIRAGYDDNWGIDGRLMVVQDKPLPLTLVYLVKEVSA